MSKKVTKVFGPRALIEVDKCEEKLKSGIYVPGAVQEQAFTIDTATILDVGEGYWQAGVLVKPEVKVGDRIIVPRMVPKVECPYQSENGNKLYFIAVDEIVAKIEDKDETVTKIDE